MKKIIFSVFIIFSLTFINISVFADRFNTTDQNATDVSSHPSSMKKKNKIISVKLWWYMTNDAVFEAFPQCFRICDNNVQNLFYDGDFVPNDSCNSDGGGTDKYCTGSPDRPGIPAKPVEIAFLHKNNTEKKLPTVDTGMQGTADTICTNILNTKFEYHKIGDTKITCIAKKVKKSDLTDYYDIFVIFSS
jgi:hypothetical protein